MDTQNDIHASIFKLPYVTDESVFHVRMSRGVLCCVVNKSNYQLVHTTSNTKIAPILRILVLFNPWEMVNKIESPKLDSLC